MIHVTFDSDELFIRPGKWFESIVEAEHFAEQNKYKIYRISTRGPKPFVRDHSAFEPGYNPGLGMVINDRGQYREELKRRNLIEAGNEYFKPTFTPKHEDYAKNEELNRELYNNYQFSDSDINEFEHRQVDANDE